MSVKWPNAGHQVPLPGRSLLLTVEESARELRIAKRRVWALIQDGSLSSVKIGRSRRISRDAIEQYVRQLEAHAESADQSSDV
jgi:excisionase family DNA binding protein